MQVSEGVVKRTHDSKNKKLSRKISKVRWKKISEVEKYKREKSVRRTEGIQN